MRILFRKLLPPLLAVCLLVSTVLLSLPVYADEATASAEAEAGFAPDASSADLPGFYVARYYGRTRFETAIRIADVYKARLGLSRFQSVIIASGLDFADALSGSYLSCVKNAPILLSDSSQDHIDLVRQYIEDNLEPDGTVYLLGGSAVVPDKVAAGLNGYHVKRLWGSDRYETNIAILEEAGVGDELLICSGTGFADSLSASATGRPILLVTAAFRDRQEAFLDTLSGKTFYIVGGTGAVSASIEDALRSFGPTVRISGRTRYETSAEVAGVFCPHPLNAVVAYGANYPDGLCGGSLAYAMGGPVLLAQNGLTRSAEIYTHEKGLQTGAVLGGPSLVSDESAERIFGRMPIDPETAVISSIHYELGGGVNSPDNPASYIEGISVKLADPSRDNHVFCGWYLDAKHTNQISEISQDCTGDITLYAKWHLAALNINGEGLDDMIWSWWYYPQAVSSDSGIYWGYATKAGYCGVAKYDRYTGLVTKTALKLAAADDHNGLALTLLDDGRIMAVYAGGHNTDNEIHVRLSDAPGDISRFSSDTVLESAGKTCYSQIIKSGGRYYLFYRVNNSRWAYRYSDDLSRWSSETILITAPMQYYCRFAPTTKDSIIRILMYSNPSESAPEIRMGFFDTSDNGIYDGSAFSTGTETPSAASRLSPSRNPHTSFPVILEPPEGKTQRLFDCAVTDPDKPQFLYSTFTRMLGSDDDIYYLYASGSTYEICAGGTPLMDYKYQLGASFVNESLIVAARNCDDTDSVELYRFEGASVSYIKTLDVQTGIAEARNARPIVDVNGQAVLWHNGYYSKKSYTNFDTSARLYLLASDTLIK